MIMPLRSSRTQIRGHSQSEPRLACDSLHLLAHLGMIRTSCAHGTVFGSTPESRRPEPCEIFVTRIAMSAAFPQARRGRWVIVQDGIYRYGVAQVKRDPRLDRSVCNYLETKACWNDPS